MRTPVEFVVTRHLLTHPQDRPADIAKHCNLLATSAARAYHHVVQETQLDPQALFEYARSLPERPFRRTLLFKLPNPEQWKTAYTGDRWLSGEGAAAIEGYNLIPERHLYYIPREDMQEAMKAAFDSFGRVAPASDWNLALRDPDPWLFFDEQDMMVERGQRLLDYWESKHVQLTARVMFGGILPG